MEKYARQAVSEGVKNADDLRVGGDSEIYRVLNLHYNRNNHIEVNWRSWRYAIHQSILNFTYLSYSIWILRVTNCSQNCFKKNSSTWNLSPIFSPPTDILNLTTKIFLKYFAKKQRNDPGRQPPAHPMIRQSNFRDVASESSCQSRNFDGSEKIGRESETAARPAQLFGGRPWPRHRYLAFLISWNAFKRIRVWFASVSVERRVLQIIRTSLTFPLWGAIYFRHGVTTVDCIWSGGGGGGRRERGAHT